MRLHPDETRRRFATGRVAYLAALRADGTAALVRIVVEVIGNRVVSAVEPKPKRTPQLAPLRHIAQDPRVTLLVDHYEDDWQLLWWARAQGEARPVAEGAERDEALARMLAKYPQYETLASPFGDAVIVEVKRWTGWSAT